MRALVLPLLILGACVEDVPIAAECPPHSGPCLLEVDGGDVEPDPPEEPAPTARVDAGTPRDASPSMITSPDAGPRVLYPLPPIENPSFEFADSTSVAGDVTTVGSLTTSINPWYTCQPIGGYAGNSVTAVRAETGLSAGTTEGAPKQDVRAKNGDTFVTVGYLVNLVPMPLMQRLDTPLKAGQRYAFVLDALATSSAAMLSLEVRGNEQGCLGLGTQPVLHKSAPITSLTWTNVCVSFTPSSDLSYLILAAEPNFPDSQISPAEMLIEGDILGGPRLVLDNIREARSDECPNL